MQRIVKNIQQNKLYQLGWRIYNDGTFAQVHQLTEMEMCKNPKRFDIINFLAGNIRAQTYLEIGVRNPDDNFNRINIAQKYSVDPGVEFEANPVDFKMTSDDFFTALDQNKLSISNNIKFDIIFIDGLHLAAQVDKDIANAARYISENGFIVLHDCNPPTEYHARENYQFNNSPADGFWNGTTWKAFVQARTKYYSCCIDSDWGVGILSSLARPGFTLMPVNENVYFDFNFFSSNRVAQLNLLSFDALTTGLGN